MVELEQTRTMLENLGLGQAAVSLDAQLDYIVTGDGSLTRCGFLKKQKEDWKLKYNCKVRRM